MLDKTLVMTFDETNLEDIIRTNLDLSAIDGVLAEWVESMVSTPQGDLNHALGPGKDVYTITIRHDGDGFQTTSDTGHVGLTLGLVMYLRGRIERGEATILPLETLL